MRLLLLVMLLSGSILSAQEGREFYQFKIYSFDSEAQVKATETYLKDAYLPALKAAGISSVGVFKEHATDDAIIGKVFVLIPFNSMDDFIGLDGKLAANSKLASAGAKYLEAAHDNPPYQRIESILLKAFIDMPKMKTPNSLNAPRNERIYELRSYESATETDNITKVDMFNAGGEVTLFNELGFNAVFYGEVISGPKMPNLMYMTTHENEESQTANWKAFVESETWTKLKAMPKYQNTVSHIDKYMLYPTEYSDY